MRLHAITFKELFPHVESEMLAFLPDGCMGYDYSQWPRIKIIWLDDIEELNLDGE